MNRILYAIIVSAALLSLPSSAQRTVTVERAGTLASQIGDGEKYRITELTVIGPLNGDDLALLRDMAGNDKSGTLTAGRLERLDLGNARIEGGGMYLDTDAINYQEGGGSATGSFHMESRALTMPDWCFYGCNSLEEVVLPQSTTAIGKGAFMDMRLTRVTVPDGVKSIGERAFYHDIYLEAFRMPQSVRTIGANAFAYSDVIEEIDLPLGVREIGKNAFRKCTALKTVTAHMARPCELTGKTFEGVTATLLVPRGTKAAYAALAGWAGFADIQETDEEPRTPTVRITLPESGRLLFSTDQDLDFSQYGNSLRAFVATAYEPEVSGGTVGGSVRLSRVMQAPAGTGLYLRGWEGSYDVPVTASAACYASLLTATDADLGATVDGRTASHVNLTLAPDDNGTAQIFRSIDGEAQALPPGSAYLQIPLPIGHRPATATGEPVTITLSGDDHTFSSTRDLDFSTLDGQLEAYVATGYDRQDGTAWLTRVYDVPAGTGVYLRGEEGTYSVPTVTDGYANQLEPVLASLLTATPTDGRAYLQLPDTAGETGEGDGQDGRITAFTPAIVEETVSVAVQFSVVDFVEVGIKAVLADRPGHAAESDTHADRPADTAVYTLQGLRIGQPRRGGIYIRDGRKFVQR